MRTISLLGVTCTALLLSACASTGGAPAARESASKRQIDSVYVTHVENLADRRGVDVHWVNPPTRRNPPKH